jgi:predicted aldo/keto reductase-like oxidoreductase
MKTQAGGYKKEKIGGLTPHQAALKYVLMDPNVSCAVPGVTTIEQIEECATVMGASLSKKDLNELKQYQSFLRGRICTMCGGCIGECPYGVLRSDLLRAVMYYDGYQNNGLVEEALQKTHLLQNITLCSECPSCFVVCRRGLDMKAQVRLVQEFIARS